MRNRPKPNRAAYASNGTPKVKKSTDIPPLEKELAQLKDPTPQELAENTEERNRKVKVLSKDCAKAEVIEDKKEDVK